MASDSKSLQLSQTRLASGNKNSRNTSTTNEKSRVNKTADVPSSPHHSKRDITVANSREMKKRMSRRSSAKKNSPSSNHSSNPESSDERGVSVSLAPGQELQGYDSSPSTPLQPQDSQLTAVAAKFDKFTLFPKLPAELRLKIWRSAIGCTSNIIKLDLDISPHFISWSCEKERSTDERKLRGVMRDFNEIVLKYNLTCKDAPNDVLLGVCVESRTEALKRMKSYIQLRREPQGKTWTHPGTAVVDLESEKIWFNPATDTIYLDKRSTFVLSTMNLGYSALRRRLHNFDKIKTVGVDEFDIRTKGLELLMRHFFHGASKVVPIRDKDGDPAMQGLMSTVSALSVEMTESVGGLQTSMGEKETRGLVWEIMRVEAQIKWAKVEIQSTATDAALLVNEKDSHLTPKLEKLEQRVEVAEDFLESAKKTPAQFDRTRELLSRPAVVKQFDWMSALGSFLQDVEQFECLARYSIEKVTGRDTVTLVRRERRLRTLREREEVEKSLGSLDGHSASVVSDDRKRLEELHEEYSRVKEQLTRQRIIRNLNTKQAGYLNKLIKLREAVMKDLERGIKEAETKHGADGLFKQVILLLRSLRSPFWIAGVKDKDGNEVAELNISVGPENFFQNLIVYMPSFLQEVTSYQRERYIELRAKMLAALSNPNLPEHLSTSLGKALHDSFHKNVVPIIKSHKAGVGAAEKEAEYRLAGAL
ncbi:hypothetical protein BKA61DRAFT_731266 [Leptodontidium sp. MPI-SDFR-AT-0119]|nr:hypothetical protein BKA61DRAFT_731266 [Leptodontidium sp. MPI-SDFR-AT-0119]